MRVMLSYLLAIPLFIGCGSPTKDTGGDDAFGNGGGGAEDGSDDGSDDGDDDGVLDEDGDGRDGRHRRATT